MPQLECRVVIRHGERATKVGMFDPISMRYEPLGEYRGRELDKMIRGLAQRIEREGHKLTFSETHERNH